MGDEKQPIDDGGPAFASQHSGGDFKTALGLSKREYFAGLAMQGWLGTWRNEGPSAGIDPPSLATFACEMADALLAALKGDG